MYSCSTCHCSFTRKQNYDCHLLTKKHMMRYYTNSKKNLHSCDICQKSFTFSQALYKHKKNCIKKNEVIHAKQEEIPLIQPEQNSQEEMIQSMQKQIDSLSKRLDSNLREKRHKISASIRNEIAERQLYHCGTCKQILGPHYHIDHIIALQFGGDNCIDNLMALCYECHVAKSIKETQCKTQIREAVKRIIHENQSI